MKRLATAIVVFALTLQVGLSIVWPHVVPRLAVLPRPADSDGRYDDAYGCLGNAYHRSYQRKGLFWIPTESSSTVCFPMDEPDPTEARERAAPG